MKSKLTTIDQELDLIQRIIEQANLPLSRASIKELLTIDIAEKTLQRRLKELVNQSRITTKGQRSGLKYLPLAKNVHSGIKAGLEHNKIDKPLSSYPLSLPESWLSIESQKKLSYLTTPSYARKKVTYNSALIDSYIPNTTRYVPTETASKLQKLGIRFNKKLTAGTYAKDIAQRLLIDLSFNSSRLEGNTYSILDTENLLQIGEAVGGKYDEETIMILNHKEAILFLIDNAEELSITPFVIRNLHQLLSQDLLPDSASCGQIRNSEVSITKTPYLPLNSPQQLEEMFTLILRKADQINNPFERSFFLLMHLSYLQAFEDVNKRTARLSCNLPFIQDNLCPLSFVDVPKDEYLKTLIYFYETGDYQPALEVFVWAYEQSSQQYRIVEQSMGVIDSYKIKYRSERKQILGEIIREMITNNQKIQMRLEQFCDNNQIENKDKFIAIVTVELDKLHSGAIATLGVTKGIFDVWRESRGS